MTTIKWGGRALGAVLIAGSLSGCSDFLSDVGENRNVVPNASVGQLLTTVQINAWYYNESQIARLTSMWLNQMAGTDRQFAALDQYIINESSANGEFTAPYTGGGLVDIQKAIAQAEELGYRNTVGVLKVHQAFLFGMHASIFGAIPFSEAGNLEITEPKFDTQAEVYAGVQKLLDEAITDLAATASTGDAAVLRDRDLRFRGNAARWTAVAWSLKARFHMHLAEVDPARYGQALAAAQKGIMTPAGNWTAVHSGATTEANLWHQFQRDRSGYISGGALLINKLKAANDPRLQIYFTPGSRNFAGQYVGSAPGTGGTTTDPGVNASNLNVPGNANYNQPIVTCAETQFIIAEAQHHAGNTAASNAALQAGIACQEGLFGIEIPRPAALSGNALLVEIIDQKYKALFLNMEAYNDYKRTCLPDLSGIKTGTSVAGKPIPRRLLYGSTERETNSNTPENPPRNTNDPGDPAGCTP